MGTAILQRALAFVLCSAALASAQSAFERQKIQASDGLAQAEFGLAVAVDGDVAAIGAPHDNRIGAVYVFRKIAGTWVEEQKLVSSDASPTDWFGTSVDIQRDRVVVGAADSVANGKVAGSAYVFQFDGSRWTELQKISASDGASGDLFGISVALDGDRIVVGAEGSAGQSVSEGAAYVFRLQGTWIEEQKLQGSHSVARSVFGHSVAIHRDRIAIGAPADPFGHAPTAGYVFHFDGSRWNEEFVATQPGIGHTVSIHRHVLATGSPLRSWVRVYRRAGTSWSLEATLRPPDPSSSSFFGSSVQCYRDLILIGAPHHGTTLPDTGAAFLMSHDGSGWSPVAVFEARDRSTSDQLGFAVALDGETALAGAHFDDGGRGSAYLFDASRFLLRISPAPVVTPSLVSVSLSGGESAGPFLLHLSQVNGVPQPLHLFQGNLDSAGQWNLQTVVPRAPILIGNTLTLSAWSIDATGTIVATNEVDVTLQ